ncbi:MAG TPA: hypothetical protein PKA33_00235 [Amaricoccus sp.]|uniref:hypothetical protein n=1 Tax=Amaricoccus sp. TaxID=1872485 RepID=UPI002CD679D5|nr:hypothetical protein [Amaricoccus sp.]HMQ92285.1 hypothetical protein [Amaricoccus sp.]HMR51048.1 hypothetical protein [Amaricoccus sp.]HMT97773.1 hypothetical protein [Amaricoccus sp.]
MSRGHALSEGGRSGGAALGILLGLMLAGCASGVPVERQVVVPGARFQAVQGEARLTVRTFLEDEAGERQEVLGANCAVRSSLYETELVTPSVLVLPNFGPQSPELEFACRAGELAGAGRADIDTFWRSYPGGWGYPGPYPWRPPYGWGGWGLYGPAYPVSNYPNVSITLR